MNRFTTWLFTPEDPYLFPTELPWREMLQVVARRFCLLLLLTIPGLAIAGACLAVAALALSAAGCKVGPVSRTTSAEQRAVQLLTIAAFSERNGGSPHIVDTKCETYQIHIGCNVDGKQSVGYVMLVNTGGLEYLFSLAGEPLQMKENGGLQPDTMRPFTTANIAEGDRIISEAADAIKAGHWYNNERDITTHMARYNAARGHCAKENK